MFKQIKMYCKRYYRWIWLLIIECYTSAVFAALPPAPTPGTQGDYVEEGLSFVSKGINAIIPILDVGAILLFVGVLISKFKDAKEERKWGDFGVVFVVGLIMLVVVLYLLHKAQDVLKG